MNQTSKDNRYDRFRMEIATLHSKMGLIKSKCKAVYDTYGQKDTYSVYSHFLFNTVVTCDDHNHDKYFDQSRILNRRYNAHSQDAAFFPRQHIKKRTCTEDTIK
jgi:hypothetical protein